MPRMKRACSGGGTRGGRGLCRAPQAGRGNAVQEGDGGGLLSDAREGDLAEADPGNHAANEARLFGQRLQRVERATAHHDMRATMAAQGADVVYAVRRKRAGETLFKKATAAVIGEGDLAEADPGNHAANEARLFGQRLQRVERATDMRATMAAQGADVVYAVRRKRAGETLFKKATAGGPGGSRPRQPCRE
jgi:hypothetical protein